MNTKKILIKKEIPSNKSENWSVIRNIEIIENHEELVQLNTYPEKIICHPEYFIQNINHSLPVLYVRKGLYTKLLDATRMLPKGYKFVVYDAYRPVEVQRSLFDLYKAKLKKENPDIDEEKLTEMTLKFVSLPSTDPQKPSPHNTGGAIDLTICDENGILLNMGSYFDDMNDIVVTGYFEDKLAKEGKLDEKDQIVLQNRRMLYNIMIKSGFTNFTTEWWHFDYGNQLWAYQLNLQTAFYGPAQPFFFWKNQL